MRSYAVLACALGLSAAGASAQSAGYVEASDYSDYFSESDAPASDAPRTIGEARKQGRAYRLGQGGRVGGRPSRDAHTVHEGDTLWDISERYYGDPWHWPEVWSYNPEITNPHWIYPLDQVRLTAEAAEKDAATAQAVAAATGSAGKSAAIGFKEPPQGLATDLAPRVTVPPKLLSGDTIFLRDEGYLDDEDMKSAGKVLAAAEEQMLLSDSDIVYLHFNKGTRVAVGQQYTVYRPVYKWEREMGEHGRLVRIQGTVLIDSFDPAKATARARVTETIDPIERGMPVIMMERRFILEPPRPNRVNLIAHIIGSTQPRTLLSYGNVVFLDVGNDKGIQPGNRFFVIRRGDDWFDVLTRPADQMGNIVPIPRYRREDLPKEVVAELRVIKVRKKVVIAVITQTKTDVFQGDTVEMRVGY